MAKGRVTGWRGIAAAAWGLALCCSCREQAQPAGNRAGTRSECLIILLDLNYTLVENREESVRAGAGDFDHRLAHERYRAWLRDLVKGQHVILITARPDPQKARTLARIEESAGWRPDEAYFNERNLPPPECKRDILERHIFPRHGAPGEGIRYVAVESNPRTAAMYASLGIPGLRVWEPGQYGTTKRERPASRNDAPGKAKTPKREGR